MEKGIILPSEKSRIIYLDKKRKCQGEVTEIPWPKHVRWNTVLESASSSDLSSNAKTLRGSRISSEDESAFISSMGSSDFPSHTDSVSSSHYGVLGSSSSSGVSAGGISSQFHSDHSETRGLRPESSSINEEHEHDDRSSDGVNYHENFEDQDRQQGGFEQCTDSTSAGWHQSENIEQLENDDDLICHLQSIGVDPWTRLTLSENQVLDADGEGQGPKKLTIDKEFEQYFSSLLL